jgi:ribosomal protein S18 acetylase RimI-like enzyme
MTVEGRLTIMRAPDYAADLDLVVVAPDGSLAAFCVCNLQRGNEKGIAYTEPIGTHPRYHRLGLGKAILGIALNILKEKGCNTVGLGTSSENVAMQRLAESLGFALVDEKLWFSRAVE